MEERLTASQATTLFASGGHQEIYACGFSNPYRFCFDLPSSKLILADAGQELYEEIDGVTKGGNHGWKKKKEGIAFIQPTISSLPCRTPIKTQTEISLLTGWGI